MNEIGYSSKIFYFKEEGRQNLDYTINLVVERAIESNISKILVFTSDGLSAIKLNDIARNKGLDIQIFAVVFPQHYEVTITQNDEKQKILPPTSEQAIKKMITSKDITLIQGVLPFEDILIPGVRDVKLHTIDETLSLISGGLKLCIQSILMATDGGYIDLNEEVIAMSADTAIIATGCRKYWLFHPEHGLEVKEIICKPKNFTISRKRYHTEK